MSLGHAFQLANIILKEDVLTLILAKKNYSLFLAMGGLTRSSGYLPTIHATWMRFEIYDAEKSLRSSGRETGSGRTSSFVLLSLNRKYTYLSI